MAALLKDYPQLEEVLIDMSPSFKKLRNPVLRRTVARVATLRQVAQVGNIPVGQLVNALRRHAGLAALADSQTSDADAESEPPLWFDPAKIVSRLDARPMIEAGRQPMGTVMASLRKLEPGQIYELITPFEPAPLIDMARRQGFTCWSTAVGQDEYKTYYVKA